MHPVYEKWAPKTRLQGLEKQVWKVKDKQVQNINEICIEKADPVITNFHTSISNEMDSDTPVVYTLQVHGS